MNASTQREKIEKLKYVQIHFSSIFGRWGKSQDEEKRREGLGFDYGFGDAMVSFWQRGIGGCS
jgi:hypothetical protein